MVLADPGDVRISKLIDPIVRAFRWHRRWFAAIFAAIAMLAALNALSPTASGTVPVVVAAHQVGGGSKLTAADLSVLQLPADAVADGAFDDPSNLIGSEVVGTVPARGVLTKADLLDSNSLVGAGKVAVPVRFNDADAVAILKVGTRVDILGRQSTQAGMAAVARNVRVVALPSPGSGGALGSTGSGIVLVEADDAQAAAILSATSAGALEYVLR